MITDLIADSAKRFTADTANHEMVVLHDDGLYRHLRFQAPDHSFYWFDLVTWPGKLAVVGDGDGYVFSRLADMFEFFRSGRGINPPYWAEKIVSGREGAKTYSEDRFRTLVDEYIEHVADEYPGLRAAVVDEVLSDDVAAFEQTAREALNTFQFRSGKRMFTFVDSYEWDLRDWDFWFLRACHAIKWGIARYDAARAVSGAVSV